MRTSENVSELFTALALAQADLTDPDTDAKNDHFGSSYATLSAGTAVIRAALSAHGLAYIQGQGWSDVLKGPVLVTKIVHSSGQWLETDYRLKLSEKPQEMAGANTYARRHALFGAVGIAPADNDGNDPKDVNTEKIQAAGAQLGRRWVVAQILKEARKDYNGGTFSKALKDAKVAHSLEHVKLFCLWLGKDKPSRLAGAPRAALVGYLATDKGAEQWATFVKECGPLPTPKTRAPKKAKPDPKQEKAPTEPQEPAGEPEPPKEDQWTPKQAAAFLKRLAELDWDIAEIQGWCVAHDRPIPALMKATQRKGLLAWLVKDVDTVDGTTQNGGDVILAWLDTQRGDGDGEE